MSKIMSNDLCVITVEGHGSYTVTRSIASSVAQLCEAAQEVTAVCTGSGVPLYITDVGPNSINAIRFVRQVTGRDLRSSKQLCDSVVRGEALLGVFSLEHAQAIKMEAVDYGMKIRMPTPLEMLAQQAE